MYLGMFFLIRVLIICFGEPVVAGAVVALAGPIIFRFFARASPPFVNCRGDRNGA